jgi:hypothetical protein
VFLVGFLFWFLCVESRDSLRIKAPRESGARDFPKIFPVKSGVSCTRGA